MIICISNWILYPPLSARYTTCRGESTGGVEFSWASRGRLKRCQFCLPYQEQDDTSRTSHTSGLSGRGRSRQQRLGETNKSEREFCVSVISTHPSLSNCRRRQGFLIPAGCSFAPFGWGHRCGALQIRPYIDKTLFEITKGDTICPSIGSVDLFDVQNQKTPTCDRQKCRI
jgi:hypothetical protein